MGAPLSSVGTVDSFNSVRCSSQVAYYSKQFILTFTGDCQLADFIEALYDISGSKREIRVFYFKQTAFNKELASRLVQAISAYRSSGKIPRVVIDNCKGLDAAFDTFTESHVLLRDLWIIGKVDEASLARFIEISGLVELKLKQCAIQDPEKLVGAVQKCLSLRSVILDELSMDLNKISSFSQGLAAISFLQELHLENMQPSHLDENQISDFWKDWFSYTQKKMLHRLIIAESDLNSVVSALIEREGEINELYLVGTPLQKQPLEMDSILLLMTQIKKLRLLDISQVNLEDVVDLDILRTCFARNENELVVRFTHTTVKLGGVSERFPVAQQLTTPRSLPRFFDAYHNINEKKLPWPPVAPQFPTSQHLQVNQARTLAQALASSSAQNDHLTALPAGNSQSGFLHPLSPDKKPIELKQTSSPELQLFFAGALPNEEEIPVFLEREFAKFQNTQTKHHKQMIVLKGIHFSSAESIQAFFVFLQKKEGEKYVGLALAELEFSPEAIAAFEKGIVETRQLITFELGTNEMNLLRTVFSSDQLKQQVIDLCFIYGQPITTSEEGYESDDWCEFDADAIDGVNFAQKDKFDPLVTFLKDNRTIRELSIENAIIGSDAEIVDEDVNVSGALSKALTDCNLKSVAFDGCRFTEGAVSDFGEVLGKFELETLSLANTSTSCSGETSILEYCSLWASYLESLARLKVLDLSGNDAEDILGLLEVLFDDQICLANLEEIHLSHTNIETSFFLNFLSYAPKLKIIHFFGNPTTSDRLTSDFCFLGVFKNSGNKREIEIRIGENDVFWSTQAGSLDTTLRLEKNDWNLNFTKVSTASMGRKRPRSFESDREAKKQRTTSDCDDKAIATYNAYALHQQQAKQQQELRQRAELERVQPYINAAQALLQQIEASPQLTNEQFTAIAGLQGVDAEHAELLRKFTFIKALYKTGLRMIPVKGDGSCFYHAVALWQKLQRMPVDYVVCREDANLGFALRKQVYDYMEADTRKENNMEKLAYFYDVPDNKSHLTFEEAFLEYIENVRNDITHYADQIEITALSRLLGVDVIVYKRALNLRVENGLMIGMQSYSQYDQKVHLLLENVHYNLLMPLDGRPS